MTPQMREKLVRRYYELVDENDLTGLVALFSHDTVYHRPGYPPLRGHAELQRFYTDQRIIREGRHTLEMVVCGDDNVAVHGTFRGILRNGDAVDIRFADFFMFAADNTFSRRDTFFFVAQV